MSEISHAIGSARLHEVAILYLDCIAMKVTYYCYAAKNVINCDINNSLIGMY